MKILVFGANGKTGKLFANHAVAMGHEISVLVRSANASTPSGVRVIVGDALNAENVLHAMSQQDMVVDCIGGTTPWKHQTLERDVMKNIVDAMKKSGANRLLVVSALGVGESTDQSPWWYRYLVLPTFLRGSTADKTAMEKIVRGSGLDWIIARPPVLADGEAIGKARVLGTNETGHSITRVDLAAWLAEQIGKDDYVRQALVVANS